MSLRDLVFTLDYNHQTFKKLPKLKEWYGERPRLQHNVWLAGKAINAGKLDLKISSTAYIFQEGRKKLWCERPSGHLFS